MASLLRQIGVLVLLGGLGYGGWIAWEELRPASASQQDQRPERPAPLVVAAEAVRAPIERSVFAVGSGLALQRVDLKTTARALDGLEGGTLLLTLADEAARAALAEAEADLGEARAAYDRVQTLRDGGRVAAAALDTAAADLARAEARTARARDDLANRTLRAPFAGIVGFPLVDPGSVVDADTMIGSLDDLSSIRVDFRVPERFFGDVAVGAAVRAETQVWPDEVFAGVIGVSRRVDPVTRSFDVRARIDNQDFRLPSGVFLRVALVLDSRMAVLAPEEAIVALGDETALFVVADGRAQRRVVTLGARQAGRVEVVSGLAAGEMVVTRGVQRLQDGAPVRVEAEARP